MPTIENHLSHATNTLPNPYFNLEPGRWPGREHVPRAHEVTLRLMGLVSVNNVDIPVLLQRFTGLKDAEALEVFNKDILKIVSYETILAAERSGRPISDLAYPFGIVRGDQGQILGCRGFGVLTPKENRAKPGAVQPSLTVADLDTLPPWEEWANAANFPAKIYDPTSVDEQGFIESDAIPLAVYPVPSAPIDGSLNAELDEQRTAQFGQPIFTISVQENTAGLRYWPENPDTLTFVHPQAIRHAAALGYDLHNCVTLGSLVRDTTSKTVMGGSAIYVLDPNMLAQDAM